MDSKDLEGSHVPRIVSFASLAKNLLCIFCSPFFFSFVLLCPFRLTGAKAAKFIPLRVVRANKPDPLPSTPLRKGLLENSNRRAGIKRKNDFPPFVSETRGCCAGNGSTGGAILEVSLLLLCSSTANYSCEVRPPGDYVRLIHLGDSGDRVEGGYTRCS